MNECGKIPMSGLNIGARPAKGRTLYFGSNLCAALNAVYLAGESPVPGIAYLPG